MNDVASRPLSTFIDRNRETILAEWVEFARTLEPWSTGLDVVALRDHANELLSAIVEDMRAPQSEERQEEKSRGEGRPGKLTGIGRRHAIDRLEGGLPLDQLVSEYRALRASVLRLWVKETDDHDATEIIRFNEAVDETLAESASWYARKLSETREQFIAILGHDLRSPLSSIVLGAELLTTSDTLPVRDLAVAARIVASGRRMTRMVADLLDLTRTRLGAGIPIERGAMDLGETCQQVCEELEVIHPLRRVQLSCSGDLQGQWDSDRLAQVVSNLVGNALVHGAESDAVRVVAAGAADHVTVVVENGGEAIAAGDLRRIFQPMVHHARAGDRNRKGLGLGLYIAREIVVAHGGTITVASGATTTFTVRLPRLPPASAR